MKAIAHLRNLRISPRKVRLVADMIRGKSVENARAALTFTTKKSAGPMLKLLNSAAANAKNNQKDNPSSVPLYISKIEVNEGTKLKRWRARARGRGYEIQKKSSHITIALDEIKSQKKEVKKTAGKPAVKKKSVKTKKHES